MRDVAPLQLRSIQYRSILTGMSTYLRFWANQVSFNHLQCITFFSKTLFETTELNFLPSRRRPTRCSRCRTAADLGLRRKAPGRAAADPVRECSGSGGGPGTVAGRCRGGDGVSAATSAPCPPLSAVKRRGCTSQE